MPTRTTRKEVPTDISQFLPQVHVSRKASPKVDVVVRRRERRHPPKGENARDRFFRIGGQRMKNVLRDIRLIGNLSSANYEVTQKDVRVMQQALAQAIDASFSRFSKTTDPKRIEDTFALGQN